VKKSDIMNIKVVVCKVLHTSINFEAKYNHSSKVCTPTIESQSSHTNKINFRYLLGYSWQFLINLWGAYKPLLNWNWNVFGINVILETSNN